ncbi:Inosine/xanthosine triphosphatase [Frankliniella fusca]|uniref:Inosine/xanthosine triphosphatase n=1 Tax=Frankliniella fusca TaxID=407009 RepID=A0AAE1HCG0_9NEOP|nr:Inosine/xanthosine triphosphatase [Frankliniella fusca]
MIRLTNSCSNSIPITYKGQDMYLTAVNRIIVPEAEEVPCNRLAPPTFQLLPEYYVKFQPEPMYVGPPPEVLSPAKEMSLQFETLKHISGMGLFQTADLRALQRALVFPIQRAAIQSVMDSQYTGPLINWAETGIDEFRRQEELKRLQRGEIQDPPHYHNAPPPVFAHLCAYT